ncbi:MAG: hypothetical protein ACREBD_13645, partial [Blastocatellia bacterium]
MNRSIPRWARDAFAHLALFAFVFSPCANPAFAQGAKKAAPATPKAQTTQPAATQPIDQEYTASILKNTTEKFF